MTHFHAVPAKLNQGQCPPENHSATPVAQVSCPGTEHPRDSPLEESCDDNTKLQEHSLQDLFWFVGFGFFFPTSSLPLKRGINRSIPSPLQCHPAPPVPCAVPLLWSTLQHPRARRAAGIVLPVFYSFMLVARKKQPEDTDTALTSKLSFAVKGSSSSISVLSSSRRLCASRCIS